MPSRDLDTYLDKSPANVQALFTFISWMSARGFVTDIDIIRPKDALPQEFQDEEDHAGQLRRCLADSSLPLEIRVVGALIRLYGLPVVRIVELTTDRFRDEDAAAYLTRMPSWSHLRWLYSSMNYSENQRIMFEAAIFGIRPTCFRVRRRVDLEVPNFCGVS